MEEYCTILINDRDGRKMLAKQKHNNHSLLIETGRHNSMDVSDRKCTLCHKKDKVVNFLFKLVTFLVK